MTTTINYSALVERLAAYYDSLGDGRDLRSENERAGWFASRRDAANLRSMLMNLPSDLAREDDQLCALEASRATVIAKRTEIEQEIASAPDPATIADSRERDREIERQRQLHLSLELLAAGQLWRAPGHRYAPLAYLDERVREVTEQRDRLQRGLDGAMTQAEALLAASTVTT
jgi:hypothetical protein